MKKNYYSIINAYSFDHKETWQKRFVIEALYQTNQFAVRSAKKFFFSEEEFVKIFEKYIDDTRFDFWLKGIMIEQTETYLAQYPKETNLPF